MPVFARKAEEFVVELDAAVETHLDWTRRVLRCAVSRASPGDDVLAHDAHCRCRFGRWVDTQRERFNELDEAATRRMLDQHERMHAAVRRLCSALIADGAGETSDLDDFEQSQKSLLADLARFKTRLLERSARLDALTGLPLRYGLEEEFARFRLASRRIGKKVALMMIDVDHFKHVNDTYGHAVGDLALKHTAGILSRQARADEPIFRFGGEEFLQLVRVDAAVEAEAVADRLLQALRDHPMPLPENEPLQLRVSSGLAVVGYDEDMGPAIARADHALYAAKAGGRDCWRWAEPRPT
jgi:diguanylate cyclase (GGDEF)-like protein